MTTSICTVGRDNDQVSNRRENGNAHRKRTTAAATHTGHIARTERRKAVAAIVKAQRTCQTRNRMRKTPRMHRARLEHKAGHTMRRALTMDRAHVKRFK